MAYADDYQSARDNPEAFWRHVAEPLAWSTRPTKALTVEPSGYSRWFEDGRINLCRIALDSHAAVRPDATAVIRGCPLEGEQVRYSYRQLSELVARFAGGLRALGVSSGDRVVVFMPALPETLICMLACARIGAIHVVLSGIRTARELAHRIEDCLPKVVVTTTYGQGPVDPIPYELPVRVALLLLRHRPESVVVLNRSAIDAPDPRTAPSFDDLLRADPVDPVEVPSTHANYILYTSGVGGRARGVVRDTGGHAVGLSYAMRSVYGVEAEDVVWAISDPGSSVGHATGIYGPLLMGATTVLSELEPAAMPNACTIERILVDCGVTCMIASPSALRHFRAQRGELADAPPPSHHLRAVFVTGERFDLRTFRWLDRTLDVPIVDHFWQTETGVPVASNMIGRESRPVKVGSVSMLVPGFHLAVLDDEGGLRRTGEEGHLVLRAPLPPGTMLTIWNDHEIFLHHYFGIFEGYFSTHDFGYVDRDGYVHVLGRADDVLHVAGSRVATGEIADVIQRHRAVAEVAVVGADDDELGQVPVAFVVLKKGPNVDPMEVGQELALLVRCDTGPRAHFSRTVVLRSLPRGRTGKPEYSRLRQLAADPLLLAYANELGVVADVRGDASG